MSGVDIAGLVEELQRWAAFESERSAAVLTRAADALTAQAAELAEARERTKKAVSETRAFWDVLVPKGGRCRDCADFDGRCQGDGPPCDPQAHALENLAKLTRQRDEALAALKGAEVAVKPLEWREVNPACHLADTPFGSVRVYRDGAWYGQWSKEGDEQSADFEAAKSAAQSDFETRIRSALVSGSVAAGHAVSEAPASSMAPGHSGSREEQS